MRYDDLGVDGLENTIVTIVKTRAVVQYTSDRLPLLFSRAFSVQFGKIIFLTRDVGDRTVRIIFLWCFVCTFVRQLLSVLTRCDDGC